MAQYASIMSEYALMLLNMPQCPITIVVTNVIILEFLSAQFVHTILARART